MAPLRRPSERHGVDPHKLSGVSDEHESAIQGGAGPAKSVTVRVASLDVSLHTMDGGGRRVAAFLQALAKENCLISTVGVGPHGTEALENALSSRVHRIKRRLFPVPFRGRIASELPAPDGRGAVVSLIPSTNRWALRANSSWLDFPDLWSSIATNQSQTVDRFTALFNNAQASMWRKREEAEYDAADVVSVASWSDCKQLGRKALWLPTPVTTSRELARRRVQPTHNAWVYGMLANFNYPPNRDAYQRLVTEWLPMLLTNGSRIVIGGFGSETLPSTAGVEIIGPVDEVSHFYDRVDVVVVPIELGGGMKVKVVEAMVHGVPVIATEHATEGLPQPIGDECTKSGSLPRRLRDPRENSAVMNALHDFTSESFQEKFSSTWRTMMMAHG
jgi:glycosyltransferase involved in cell wall biosynthesis